MVRLDDKVLESVSALPKQLEQSFNESLKITFPEDFRKIKNIVVCGMGGSQWPARIVRELFKQNIAVPFLINSDYALPGFVNEDSLVVLSSFSGTTEESITCGKEALERGAKITGITSGGEVATFLKENNLPGYIFDPTYNPSKQPRLGFGYGVGGLLGLFANLGLLQLDETYIEKKILKTDELIAGFKPDVPNERNTAKKLAEELYQKYPYYIVAEFLAGLGNAIQNQTNENAKSISSFRVIPELNHHLLEGLKFPDTLKNILVFVFFYSSLYTDKIKKRFKITKEVVEKNKIKTIWIELKGEDKLEQAFYLMGLSNYTTIYLAGSYNQDPSVVPSVDYFKKRLSEL